MYKHIILTYSCNPLRSIQKFPKIKTNLKVDVQKRNKIIIYKLLFIYYVISN